MEALVENKREYVNRLCDFLAEPLVSLFQGFYATVKQNSRGGRDVLAAFQQYMTEIRDWNAQKTHEIADDLVSRTGCTYMPQLIKAIIVSYVKIHWFSTGTTANNVRIRVPSIDNFIHKCILTLARGLYKQPYLLYHQLRTIEQQHNLTVLEDLARQAIRNTIRSCVPMEELMAQIETVETESESEASKEDEDAQSSESEESNASESSESEESDASESSEEESDSSEEESDSSEEQPEVIHEEFESETESESETDTESEEIHEEPVQHVPEPEKPAQVDMVPVQEPEKPTEEVEVSVQEPEKPAQVNVVPVQEPEKPAQVNVVPVPESEKTAEEVAVLVPEPEKSAESLEVSVQESAKPVDPTVSALPDADERVVNFEVESKKKKLKHKKRSSRVSDAFY